MVTDGMLSIRCKVKKTHEILDHLVKKYRDHVWEVGFSGGKDSTALLHLVITFLEKRLKRNMRVPKKVIVVYGDTLLDIPLVREMALGILKDLKEYSEKNFPGVLDIRILKPLKGEDFFSMIVDRGYPAPHYRFRWCVRTLKIRPTMLFLSEHMVLSKIVMLTGIRGDESIERRRIIQKRSRGVLDGIIQRNNELIIQAAPLLHWSKDEIFAFLASEIQPWNGKPYTKLLQAYTINETLDDLRCACGLSPNVRYGCWVCTVIRKDKALERLSKLDEKWHKLIEIKEMIRIISHTKRFRTFDEQGFPRRLNKKGRLAIVALMAKVLIEYEEALAGYLEDSNLRAKLTYWLESLRDDPECKQICNYVGVDSDMVSRALAKVMSYPTA